MGRILGATEHGALNNPEFAGLVFDEPSVYDYIPMSVRSAMSSLDEKEFEFDISGMSTVESSQELEVIASPTEKLLYKWRTQPFHHTISTQVVEKSSFSQTKPFGAQATTETENMGSRKKISRNCSLEKEELRSSASHKSCDDPSYKVDKDSKDIHSKVSAPYRSKKQMDSAQSRQTAMCHNFRASSTCRTKWLNCSQLHDLPKSI